MAGGAGFISNLILWSEAGYFDSTAETKPLLHLWSLGVEEQFYIFWPIFALIAWRKGVKLPIMIFAIILASFSLNIASIDKDPTGTFYSPLSRFWELSIGGALAYATLTGYVNPQKQTAFQANTISITGLSMLVLGIFFINKDQKFPGWLALIPTIGSVLIISAGKKSWINSNLLSNKIFVWIGLISFPLYLWHWPLLSFARVIEGGQPSTIIRTALIASAIILAFLTYQLIEKKIRFKYDDKKVITFLVVAMFTLGLIGLAINNKTPPLETRISTMVNPEAIRAINDWTYPNGFKNEIINDLEVFSTGSKTPSIIFYGDSHIEHYGSYILELVNSGKIADAELITAGGCPPIPHVYEDLHPQCKGRIEKFENLLQSQKSIKSIVIGGCWNCYFIKHGLEQPANDDRYNYYYANENGNFSFRKNEGREKALLELGVFLKKLKAEIKYKIYLLADNPVDSRFDPANMLGNKGGRRAITFSNESKGSQSVMESFQVNQNQIKLNERLKLIASEAGVNFLDQLDSVCPKGTCTPVDDIGRPIYKDDNHMRTFFIQSRMNALSDKLTH